VVGVAADGRELIPRAPAQKHPCPPRNLGVLPRHLPEIEGDDHVTLGAAPRGGGGLAYLVPLVEAAGPEHEGRALREVELAQSLALVQERNELVLQHLVLGRHPKRLCHYCSKCR